jgi:hypothetical protein
MSGPHGVATDRSRARRRRPSTECAVRWRALVAGLGLLLIGANDAPAQDNAGSQSPPTFRSTVDLVTLHVTVTDDAGRYVAGLDAQQFQVLEDGRPQELRVFEPGGFPLAVTLFLDVSSSMYAVFPAVQ